MRDQLLRERDEQIADASTPVEPHAMSPADSATDEFDHELAVGLLSHEQDALYEVDAAIRRILDGSYGICEETGRPIPSELLAAVPWTRFTKEVQEKREREGISPTPRLGDLASAPHTRMLEDASPTLALEDPPLDDPTSLDSELLPFRAAEVTQALEDAALEGSTTRDANPSSDEAAGDGR